MYVGHLIVRNVEYPVLAHNFGKTQSGPNSIVQWKSMADKYEAWDNSWKVLQRAYPNTHRNENRISKGFQWVESDPTLAIDGRNAGYSNGRHSLLFSVSQSLSIPAWCWMKYSGYLLAISVGVAPDSNIWETRSALMAFPTPIVLWG